MNLLKDRSQIGLLMTVLLLIAVHSLPAQTIKYDSVAIHYPIEGAREQFSYYQSDSLKKPVGTYTWTLKRETDTLGQYELALLKTNFRNGLPEGEIAMAIYLINFEIEEFDLEKIKTQTRGDHYHIEGKYVKGVPTGEWVIEKKAYLSEKASTTLRFHTSKTLWEFNADSLSFSGKTDAGGYFVGNWKWKLSDKKTKAMTYDRGILEGVSSDGKQDTSANFIRVKEYLKKPDSLQANPDTLRWLWVNGFSDRDSYAEIQQPIEPVSQLAAQSYQVLKKWMGMHPFLAIPELKGTRQLYFKLSETDVRLAELRIKQLNDLDTLLSEKIDRPIFQLRRNQNPELDEMLTGAEDLLAEIRHFSTRTTGFLMPTSRTNMPHLLAYDEKSNFPSHAAYLRHLLSKGTGISTRVQDKITLLDKTIEQLREEGAVTDLESEWFAVNTEILENHRPESDTLWFSSLFEHFLVTDFEDKKQAYGLLGNISDQKQFLIRELEWHQYLLDFYQHKQYMPLTFVEDELLETYTKMLYNPYMGVNNVVVVVKKRFLERVIDEFWPYLTAQMEDKREPEVFQAQVEILEQYKATLKDFADDKSPSAKRLERKGRVVKSMEEMEQLLKIYLSEQ